MQYSSFLRYSPLINATKFGTCYHSEPYYFLIEKLNYSFTDITLFGFCRYKRSVYFYEFWCDCVISNTLVSFSVDSRWIWEHIDIEDPFVVSAISLVKRLANQSKGDCRSSPQRVCVSALVHGQWTINWREDCSIFPSSRSPIEDEYCLSQKNRSRNILWYNPPFRKNVKTNVGRCFLYLIDQHFPKSNLLHKVFNRNRLNWAIAACKYQNCYIQPQQNSN